MVPSAWDVAEKETVIAKLMEKTSNYAIRTSVTNVRERKVQSTWT